MWKYLLRAVGPVCQRMPTDSALETTNTVTISFPVTLVNLCQALQQYCWLIRGLEIVYAILKVQTMGNNGDN